MSKRTFSKKQKLQILKEASDNGVNTTLEKHGIYPATYYLWKKKHETMGEAGFRHGMTPAHLKEIKRLEKENATLPTPLKQTTAGKSSSAVASTYSNHMKVGTMSVTYTRKEEV